MSHPQQRQCGQQLGQIRRHANLPRITVSLGIVPDEDNSYATLRAVDDGGDPLAEVRVAPSFKLNRSSAVAWAEGGFA